MLKILQKALYHNGIKRFYLICTVFKIHMLYCTVIFSTVKVNNNNYYNIYVTRK